MFWEKFLDGMEDLLEKFLDDMEESLEKILADMEKFLVDLEKFFFKSFWPT